MVDALKVELVAPEKLFLSESVDMVVLPGSEGDFGVMLGHSPLISMLRSGEIVIFEGGEIKNRILIGGGFAEVTGRLCTVLSEEVENVSEIDRDEAEQMLSDVEEEMRNTDDILIREKLSNKRAHLAARIAAVQRPAYSS